MSKKSEAPLMQMAEAAFIDNRANMIVETMRQKFAAAGMGVTVIGTNITVRFSTKESPSLKQVTMNITDIVDDAVRDENYLEDGQ